MMTPSLACRKKDTSDLVNHSHFWLFSLNSLVVEAFIHLVECLCQALVASKAWYSCNIPTYMLGGLLY